MLKYRFLLSLAAVFVWGTPTAAAPLEAVLVTGQPHAFAMGDELFNPPGHAIVLRYDIGPGGQYTYFPSPESLGIPGCDPSDFECVFGIEGSFSVMVDTDTNIATLLDVDLTLIGNEEVQQSAPTPFVTATGVADWLEDRSFGQLVVGAPFNLFADETYPNLQLADFLNGTVTLSGGFNNTPADGDGVDFDLTAQVVPEPSTLVLAILGLLGLFGFAPHRRLRVEH